MPRFEEPNIGTTGVVLRTSSGISITTMAAPTPRPRTVFVAYPYALPRGDYRRPFTDLAKAFDVEFQFADERITNRQILDKIADMIVSARFNLFDVTRWNANVALELGIAIGGERPYYLLFNPSDPENPKGRQVPSDLGGLDRIEYRSYTELEERLSKLLAQEFGLPTEDSPEDPVRDLSEQIAAALDEKPGLKIGEIAGRLGVSVDLAQVLIRPLLESGQVGTEGVARGTKYFLAATTP
jgi:hypothetical protein